MQNTWAKLKCTFHKEESSSSFSNPHDLSLP